MFGQERCGERDGAGGVVGEEEPLAVGVEICVVAGAAEAVLAGVVERERGGDRHVVALHEAVEREKQRLSEELEKMTDNLQRLTARLSDERFLAKAPEEGVERERERLESTESRRARVAETLARLGG